MNKDELKEIKNYWCRDDDNYPLADREVKDICDLVAALEAAQAENEAIKDQAWKTVELEEGNLVVFVGVHAVSWEKRWGEPSVGFTRWRDDKE